MWHRLKVLLLRLFAHCSFTQLSLRFVPAIRGTRLPGSDGPDGPYDLDSRVREPRWRGPTGRTASVAVDEPEEEEMLFVSAHKERVMQ